MKNFVFLDQIKKYDQSDARYRLPLALAIFSVAFQEFPSWKAKGYAGLIDGNLSIYFFTLVLIIASGLAILKGTTRVASILFLFVTVFALLPDWTVLANHTYLAIWCINVALLFKEPWNSKDYMSYLRITLGIVMLAAFGQKILAGTYLDGSYLTYLSLRGSTTESLFSLFCEANPQEPCSGIKYISIFILAWQFAVGILLLAGLNSILFLFIEIGFLLGAGVYADEMNFQVLNIALLCIVFRYGMPFWLLITCVGFLVIDIFSISKIINWVV